MFADETAVYLGDAEVHAYHFGRGHTNGDAVIYFADLRAIHTGDLFIHGQRLDGSTLAPFWDVRNGGSAVAGSSAAATQPQTQHLPPPGWLAPARRWDGGGSGERLPGRRRAARGRRAASAGERRAALGPRATARLSGPGFALLWLLPARARSCQTPA